MDKMLERHALKFAGLAVVQQQRIMRKLANAARAHARDNLKNAESAEANHYDWHRRVRLSREARAIHLIRAFLKGTPYNRVEQTNCFHTLPPSIIVTDYGPFTYVVQVEGFNKQFNDWVAA